MKMLQMVLGLLATVLFTTPVLAAESATHQWDISGFGGGVFPTEEDSDSTGYFGGRVNYNVNQNVALGLESGWMSFEQEEDGVDFGDVNGVPLLANLFLRMPLEATENKLVPYAVAGVGVVFWSFDESSLLEANGIEIDDDTAFAWRTGLGADYNITENVAIFAEGGFIGSEWDATVRAFGAVASEEINTDMAYAMGGIKVGF